MGNVTPIIPDDWDDTPDGIEPLVLIPAGEYQVTYLRHEYFNSFGDYKAKVFCEITQGEFAGTTLHRFLNVRRENKRYRPPVSPHSHYRIDMQACAGIPTANLSRLRGLDLIATVSTVTHDSHRNLAIDHQYSLIRRLRKA